ncbi:acyltransferase [Methylobacterium sp. C25]|uniref:acyltransferase family protein n=1 Tax=Methylobacterium sp. C25 TaxID=2721622 RepID=UPI001F1913DE|nr:acyltransferase [Methylobacterium sp. C25]MCE4225052.1 acyltransferase [Methylobacterium sp. C25]
MTTATGTERLNNFGTLRLLFAGLVVVSHSPELIDGDRLREPLTRLFGTLSLGEVAVDGFFLISGYLIAKSFRNSRSVLDYLAKRILRIYPGFIAASLVSIVLVAPLVGGELTQVSPTTMLARIGLLSRPVVPGVFGGLPYPDLNGAMWTVAYEFRCYLVMIFLAPILFSSNRSAQVIALAALAVLYIFRSQVPDVPVGRAVFGQSTEMIRFCFIFVIGSAFYVWRLRVSYTARGALLAASILVVTLFIAPVAEPAVAILGGYLIFWYAFACPVNRISQWMESVDPSYGLYLYAWPIQNLLIFNVAGITPLVVTAVTLPMALTLGVISWYLIEKPAQQYKRLLARPMRVGSDNSEMKPMDNL